MADLRFWLDMAHRVTLKRNDKLLIGNIDDETPNYIDVSEVLSVLNTDDLPEGTTNKYLTATQKQKLVDLPTNPLTPTEADAAYYPLGSNPSGYLTAASSLNSNKLTGLLSTSLIPDLDAAKIVSGIMNASRIPDLPATKITSGIFDVARIPNLPMSQITGLGTEFENYIPISQKAAANGVAPLDVNTLIPEGYLPGMNANKITDGVLSPDRIPTSFLQTGDLGQPNKVASLDENGYLEIGQLDIDYLDTRYSGGFKQRGAVRVSTVGNITLSGLQTIDGITLVAGDRVLVRNQADAAENGIYVVSSSVWTRATDFDEVVPGEVEQGASVFVEEGTTLARTGWVLATGGIIDLGVTGLVFTQYAGANNYTGGNLITIAGNQINHDTGSWVAKSNLSGAAVISNLSVDAYGHPTNWVTRNLTAGNIGAEPAFSKNTAFNKNFGTASGTVAQGNDSRINNGQTAFSWGDHAGAGYVPSSRTISTGLHLSGGGELSANRTLTFTPTTSQWVTDNQGNERIYFGGITSQNGINFKLSGTSQAFRYLNSSGTEVGVLTTEGDWNIARNINASGLGRFSGTGLTLTGASNKGILSSSDDSRILIGGGSQWSSNNGAYISIEGNNFGGAGSGGSIHLLPSAGESVTVGRELSVTGLIVATGTVTGSNLSGTNTGDQTLSGLGGEPAFSKNTAFNKNFGTSAGTVAEGNHTHPASAITSGTLANARISQASVTQYDSAINAGRVDGKHIWTGSQASYDAIGTKDSNTIYFIT